MKTIEINNKTGEIEEIKLGQLKDEDQTCERILIFSDKDTLEELISKSCYEGSKHRIQPEILERFDNNQFQYVLNYDQPIKKKKMFGMLKDFDCWVFHQEVHKTKYAGYFTPKQELNKQMTGNKKIEETCKSIFKLADGITESLKNLQDDKIKNQILEEVTGKFEQQKLQFQQKSQNQQQQKQIQAYEKSKKQVGHSKNEQQIEEAKINDILNVQNQFLNQINEVIDSWHSAARQHRPEYFDFFTNDARYIGTDSTEQWSLDEFKKKYLNGFKNYDIIPKQRHVYLSQDEQVAWFDEEVDSNNLGKLRGSGVLILEEEKWKIAQYVLSVPIPNKKFEKVKSILDEDNVIQILQQMQKNINELQQAILSPKPQTQSIDYKISPVGLTEKKKNSPTKVCLIINPKKNEESKIGDTLNTFATEQQIYIEVESIHSGSWVLQLLWHIAADQNIQQQFLVLINLIMQAGIEFRGMYING